MAGWHFHTHTNTHIKYNIKMCSKKRKKKIYNMKTIWFDNRDVELYIIWIHTTHTLMMMMMIIMGRKENKWWKYHYFNKYSERREKVFFTKIYTTTKKKKKQLFFCSFGMYNHVYDDGIYSINEFCFWLWEKERERKRDGKKQEMKSYIEYP